VATAPLPAHIRTIQVDAIDVPDEGGARRLRVKGILEDRRPRGIPATIHHDGEVIHHLELTLVVRFPDHVIVAVEGEMATTPYPAICPDALPSLPSLVGLSVARGFTRAVNERLGRERGCTHLVALIHAMGPVVRQGAGAAFGFAPRDEPRPAVPLERPPEDQRQGPGAEPWFVNSCQAWRAGGPLHAEWRARAGSRGRRPRSA
jgi:hypothetical protein